MRNLLNNVLILIGCYGEAAGILIVALVSLNDFLMTGVRGWFCYAIGPIGTTIIWIAVLLIVISKHIDRITK